MSSRRIGCVAPYCVTVPYKTNNRSLATLIDAHDDDRTPYPYLIDGWTFHGPGEGEDPVIMTTELYGRRLTKEHMKCLFVVCEGDDYVYLTSRYQRHLRELRRDWKILEAIRRGAHLWSVI